MKDKAIAYLRQFLALWGALPRIKKMLLVLVASATLIGAVTLAMVSSTISYEYLFTDLSTEDAATIVAKLAELKVPHQVGANGTAILVPKERVHTVRLQLAGLGLPRGGGVGFELFDKSQFGATEFEQQVNFRRALEGELSRTINTIGAVRSARVHLVLPERSVFVLRQQAGSASVVLQLKPGQDFGRREVDAVVHLVASAVPGLSSQRVSVVSSDGATLRRPRESDADTAGVGDGLAESELELARTLESRVRELLERIVGAQRADVRVRLTLDPRVRERTEEHYDPKGTVLRSEHRTTEGAGAGRSESGVPGSRSNLWEDSESSEGDGETSPHEEDYYLEADSKTGTRETTTRNWDVDRVTEKTKTPAGGIERLSIAVLVDGVYEEVDGARQFRVRDQKELAQLAGLVKGAVGFDEARGDVLNVESARFADTEPSMEPDIPPPVRMLPPWFRWYYAILPAGVLVALGIAAAMRMMRGTKGKEAGFGSLALGGRDAVVEFGPALGQVPGLPEARRRTVDFGQLRSAAIELAERDPDTASAILREWLNASPAPHPNLAAAPAIGNGRG
jgi:flagellar M-ring protein FliF